MSTSGWRDEDEVSACNAFEMSLELCLKTEITDFLNVEVITLIVESWEKNIF